MARGKKVDRELAGLILQMKERNPKLTTEQIGSVMNCDPTTAGRVIRCGSWDAFCKWKEEKARKGRERAAKAAEEQQEREPEVPGQIRMELEPKPEMSDTVKMMRFQAHEAELIIKAVEEATVKLITELDKLNDTLCMILRAVRKE